MIYVDTSVVVAALVPEKSTKRVQKWLAEQDAGGLVVSGWVVTEMSSALAMKVRTRDLTLDQRAQVLTLWRRLLEDSFVIEPVSPTDFEVAAIFLDQSDLGLRAGDALHLAVASARGMTVATLDRLLAKAGPKLGVATTLL
jgi:predicted nucleic acid-binding protein